MATRRPGRPKDPRKISAAPTAIKFDAKTQAILAEDLAAMKKRGLKPNKSEIVRRWARASNEARMREFVDDLVGELHTGQDVLQQLLEHKERLESKILQYERREQARRSKERRHFLDLILKPENRGRFLPILREYAENEAGGFRSPTGIKLLDQARDMLGDGSWQQLLELVQDEEAADV